MEKEDQSAFHGTLLRGFAWESSVRFVIQIVSWISTILVARILSPDDYGLVAIVGIFTGLLLTLTNMGLGAALINYSDVTEEDEDAVFWINLLVAASAYVVLFLLSDFIADIYGIPDLKTIIRVAGIILLVSSIKIVPYSRLTRELDFRFMALVLMGSQLTTTAVVLGMAYAGFGVWSLVVSVLVGQLLETCACLFKMHRFPRIVIITANTKPLFKYGVTFMGNRLLGTVPDMTPRVVASIILGQRSTGYVEMSMTLASLPIAKLGQIFDKITFPAISAIKNDKEHARALLIGIHKYLLLLTIPLFAGIALLAQELIVVVLTEKWMPIIPLVQILSVLNIGRISGQHLMRTLEGVGDVKTVFKYQLISAFLIPAGILIGSRWGAVGMLCGWLAVYPFIYISVARAIFSTLGVAVAQFWRSVSPVIYSTAAMIVAVSLVKYGCQMLSPLLILGICVLTGGLTFLSVCAIFFRSEFGLITNGAKRLRAKASNAS